SRATHDWQSSYAEIRKQAYQSADPDQTVGTPHHMFFQTDHDARPGDCRLHQSLRISDTHLTRNPQLCITFLIWCIGQRAPLFALSRERCALPHDRAPFSKTSVAPGALTTPICRLI